jgi:transcriptional regulator with XRE-family HTH domain
MTNQAIPDVAAEVRAAIARKQVTQRDFAAAVGLTQSGVSRRLSGRTDFTIPELTAAANFLGVELTSLLTAPALAEGLAS